MKIKVKNDKHGRVRDTLLGLTWEPRQERELDLTDEQREWFEVAGFGVGKPGAKKAGKKGVRPDGAE